MTDQTDTTPAGRMRSTAITFHDLAVSLYQNLEGCKGRAQTATGAGDFRAASLHIASAENLTQWANTLMGPGWRDYARPHVLRTPPGPEAIPSE